MDLAQLVRVAPRRHPAPPVPWVPEFACLAASVIVFGLGVAYARPYLDEQPRDIGAALGAILDGLEVRR